MAFSRIFATKEYLFWEHMAGLGISGVLLLDRPVAGLRCAESEIDVVLRCYLGSGLATWSDPQTWDRRSTRNVNRGASP